MLKRLISVFLLTTLILSAYAEFDPPAGSESYFRLLSPWLLGTGTSAVSTDAPAAASWNPAAAASAQRTTFDLGYVSIYDTEYGEGVAGHVFNLANTLPTKLGVFTWSGHFLSSNYEGIDLGSMGMLNLGFAKDVFEDLYVGTGLNFYAGENDSFDWGTTLDVGFIKFLGSYGALNNFRWGLTAKDIGIPFNPSDTYSAVPSPFTLQGGAAFTPVQKDNFSLDLHGDVILPSFQNLRIDAGLLANFDKFIQVGISSAVDFGSIADGEFDNYRWIPSFGLRFSFQTDLSESGIMDFSSRGWDKGDVQPQIGFAPLAGGAWGAGVGVTLPLGVIDETPPEIRLDLGDLPYSGDDEGAAEAGPDEAEVPVSILRGKGSGVKGYKTFKTSLPVQDSESKSPQKESLEKNILHKIPGAVYISPNNDGTKDDLSFSFNIEDSRYIKGYEFVIEDESGNRVRTIGNKEERPQDTTMKVFFERLFKRKSGIPVPETLRWDGTSEDGTVTPDGVYSFFLSAWDDNGNRTQTEKYPLVIDTRPPEIEISEAPPLELIFSPNADGYKDKLEIEQRGTLEESWNISIIAVGGAEVFNRTMRDREPSDFIWNGQNSAGSTVRDGVYTYTISSADRAGNSGSASVENIIVDTQPTPVGISINTAFFSPNGDGVQDEIVFDLETPNPQSLISWELEIRGEDNRVRRTVGGTDIPAGTIIFDGRDDAGRLLPEGRYSASYSAVYRNGNRPSEISPSFVLDISPPRATLSASPDIFSPDGDGFRDTLTITQDTSSEIEWVGRILDSADRTVREYRWIDRPEPEISWNGTSEEGDIIPDGDYRYMLASTDRAGNSLTVSSGLFRVSTGETVVALFTDTAAFSPNGDGVKDVLLLKPQVKVVEGVESYTIVIRNEAGTAVKTFRGNGALSPEYRWDGIGDAGSRMPDGVYSASISIVDRNGTPAQSDADPFTIDRIAPEASVEAPYLLFSPNGDGFKDQVSIAQTGSSENLWSGEILDERGEPVRSYRWKGRPGNFIWLGRDDAGNQVPDGPYRYRLTATDPAGNSAELVLPGLVTDSRTARAYLTADGGKISPNRDGRFDRLTFYPIVNISDGIEKWSLDLVDADGSSYAAFSGSGSELPKQIVWNGADAEGRVRDGLYTPRFSVQYLKGDRPRAELKPVRVDITTPAVTLTAEPLPFSPDNDGIEDELSISIAVDDLSPVESWSLEIFDRQMTPFTSFSGTGMPANEIIWDGRSNTGELVISAEDYPFRFTIRDDLANVTKLEGKFPVDVLVIREGNLLKIQISSIVFEPNSAKFSEKDAETAEKNSFVLDRIAQILTKYRTYRITIEGHANPVYYNDPARAQKEEEEELKPLSKDRAEAVRKALVDRGIHPGRLSVVGRGGSGTIADPGNREVNWKNRRVEFILEK
jgi:outer membrane protein OmpA-like peptidoglycan-associated protein/flagellar hook assembly protein FlgD